VGWEFENVTGSCQDSTHVGTFSENQDVQRFAAETDDLSLQMNVIAFTLLTDGIPIIYYGAEQQFSGAKDPENREALWLSKYDTSAPIYQEIKSINAVRNAMRAQVNTTYWSPYWTYKSKLILSKENYLVIRKGYDISVVTVMSNLGAKGKDEGPFQIGDTNFSEGDPLIEVLGCTSKTTGLYGTFNTTIVKGQPQVWFPAKYLKGTDVCPAAMKKLSCLSNCVKKKSSAGDRLLAPRILRSSPWVATVAVVLFTVIWTDASSFVS